MPSGKAERVWSALKARPEVLAGVLDLIDQECVATGWAAWGSSWERRVWGRGDRIGHVWPVPPDGGSTGWRWQVGDGIGEGGAWTLEEAKELVDRKLLATGWVLLPSGDGG